MFPGGFLKNEYVLEFIHIYIIMRTQHCGNIHAVKQSRILESNAAL